MSKQFEVKKIYKVIIKIPSSLDEYYNLKNIYDESIHKNKKRKCINCRKVNMASLVFTIKNRNLISICPTPDCKSNMIIPIETCVSYDDFYEESKQSYEDTIDTILGTKFNILFGYTNEKDSNILQLKESYKTNHEHYLQCISDYKDIVYPKTAELTHLEQRRDELIEQLKDPDTDVQRIHKDLKPILCNIRKLKYNYEIPNSTTIIQKPYSINDLHNCSPVAESVVITPLERERLLQHNLVKEPVDKPQEKSKANMKVKAKSENPDNSTVDEAEAKDAKKIESSIFDLSEKTMDGKGRVFLASMNMRGARAVAPEGTIKINVTSAQASASKNRLDFSPMTPIEGGYKGFYNFEAFWQSGKVYEGIPEETVKKYWHNVKEAKRRYPGSKDKKVMYAHFEHDPEKMDYVTSRKKVYVPLYIDLIKDREMTQHWKKEVDSGKDIVIYDFDGPRLKNGEVTCLEVTTEMLKEKINDPSYPFGHGYIVAGLLKGISPEQYI
jgi:hypothetical protein